MTRVPLISSSFSTTSSGKTVELSSTGWRRMKASGPCSTRPGTLTSRATPQFSTSRLRRKRGRTPSLRGGRSSSGGLWLRALISWTRATRRARRRCTWRAATATSRWRKLCLTAAPVPSLAALPACLCVCQSVCQSFPKRFCSAIGLVIFDQRLSSVIC